MSRPPEDYDLERLPFNPTMNESFMEYILRQKELYPPKEGVEPKCVGCAQCCKWSFIELNITDPALTANLKQVSGGHPHGHWILVKEKLNLFMPVPHKMKNDRIDSVHFDGTLPGEQVDFLTVSGRMHGYWVLNKQGKIVIYTPAPCQHLTATNRCRVYRTRPKVCKDYYCNRHL